jgi:hypothetical protein
VLARRTVRHLLSIDDDCHIANQHEVDMIVCSALLNKQRPWRMLLENRDLSQRFR